MPVYTRHLFICGNQRRAGHPRGCCDPEGGERLRAAFKQAIKRRGLKSSQRANRSGCLDQCEHGPCVVVYPEGVWYGRVKPADVDEIVESHLVQGQVVERLLIPDDCVNNPSCPHRKGQGEAVAAWLRENPEK
jgi:(2Fe-2S) ferredoxin